MAMYAPQLVRMLYAFAGAFLTQAYVNLQAILSIDTIINCRRVHSVTVVKKKCVSCKSNVERKV